MDKTKEPAPRFFDEVTAVTLACVLTIHLLGQATLYIMLPATLPQVAPFREFVQIFCMATLICGGVLMALVTATNIVLSSSTRAEALLQLGGSLLVMSFLGYWAFSQFPLMETIVYVMGGIGATSLGLGIGLTVQTMKKPAP